MQPLSLPTNPRQSHTQNATHSPCAAAAFQVVGELDGTNQESNLQGSLLDMSGLSAGDDLTFLEDWLLPESRLNVMEPDIALLHPHLNKNGITTPFISDMQPRLGQSQTYGMRLHSTASVEEDTRSIAEISYAHALQITNDDTAVLSERIHALDTFGIVKGFAFPGRARIVRCLTAYFEYFDSHVPFVQHATFSIRHTHPILVLAILAVGSQYVFEHQFSRAAYEACWKLLHHYGHAPDNRGESPSSYFWPIQASFLCVQLGAFSNNDDWFQRSQAQFSSIAVMLRRGLDLLEQKRQAYLVDLDWETWSFVETYTRLACWTCNLSAIILAYDPHSTFVFPHQLCEIPVPAEEPFWKARSAADWALLGGRSLHMTTPSLMVLAKSLIRGEPIAEKISSYGLLSLLGWLYGYICNHERLTLGMFSGFDSEFTARMEKALATWEDLFRSHPHANQVSYKQADSLLGDCFSLLGSAYYHLYLGKDLRVLKHLAARGSLRPWDESSSFQFDFTAQPNGPKAVRYAANSWLVRAKMGVAQLHRTAGLTFGCQYFVTAYEAALILSSWISSRTESDTHTSDPTGPILEEIYAELEEQGINCGDQASRALAPLTFHGQLMHPRIFMFTEALEARMDCFANQLFTPRPTSG
ncbi:hypothetical protein B0I35DRAFT_155359 [Stachybotrys elegans]|uniref:Xylanolytic transcriptional activator regulatory domain-containing protein n=1 Tax=Stachybotrys elegans TaxID=80388 RepID=A0A8K0S941_9HYPO|nr:hypothetical protein B0I35DRAFT_155359 [Stachybotrys elegans]